MKTLIYFFTAILFTFNLSAEAGVTTTDNKFGDNIYRLKTEFYFLQKEFKSEMNGTCRGDNTFVHYLRKYIELRNAYNFFAEQKKTSTKHISDLLAVVDAFKLANDAETEMFCEIEASHETTEAALYEKCYPEIEPLHRTARFCP